MYNIPPELEEDNLDKYDVNIIIGENASGKSVLLNNISHSATKKRQRVIAIATSVHDKFNNRSKYFHFSGGRQGRNRVSKIIKRTLIRKENEKTDRVESLMRVLEYVKYDTRVGVKVQGYNPENIECIKRDESINEKEKYDVISLLEKYHDVFIESNIVSMELRTFTQGSIYGSALSSMLKHENVMRKHKVLKYLSLYLSKENTEIPIQEASSGELMIISTLMFIASNIVDGAVILIDEPENSLHPRWQREYIKNILDLFYYQRPKIIIATHSSLIIPLKKDLTNLFIIKRHQLHQRSSRTNNNEELLLEDFGVLTPENRYLSDNIIELLNSYDSGDLSYDSIVSKISSYQDNIYDETQEEFLKNVLKIVDEIKSK
ncbi:AAA family ATPase [Desulfosediminicola sp.]|uniref:AAA family ATPase n=1 Tax=Desulfosediminicola sp. TaxID=2886825 RepID=UPI003AF1F49D